jgi:thioredoxin-like negative regulator of GroEL
MRRPLLALTAIAGLGLAGCGGSSDKDQITQLIKSYGSDPAKLCTTYATPAMVEQQFGSKAACLKAAQQPGAKDPGVQVASVTIKGNTATARRISETNPGKGSKSDLFLVKQNGQWKVRLVVPAS